MSGYGSTTGGGGSTGNTTQAAAGADGAGAGATGLAALPVAELENVAAAFTLLIVYGAVLGAFTIYNLVSRGARYIRLMSTMNSDTQRYFAESNQVSIAKRLLIYAPLFKNRVNTELQLKKLRLGVIPARLPTILLLGLVGVNVYLLVRDLALPLTPETLGSFYKRASTLAVANLLPLFFFAGRKNPFIMVTGIDFNNFNTMHRWIGRLVISEIIIHAVAVIYQVAMRTGSAGIIKYLTNGNYITQGYIAALCLVAIGIQSQPYLRKPFYETFLVTHQILVAVFLAFALRHTARFWQNQLVGLAIITWVSDRAIRFINLLRNNVSKRGTKVLAEVLPGQAMRITVYVARPWKVLPGQHLFLTLPSVSLWQSHPFSIAWSEKSETYQQEPESYEVEKGGLVVSGRAISEETSMSLIVRKRSGATSTLYNKAVKAGGRVSLRGFVEGPYGALHGLDSYGTVLLFSGGVGITHHVPYIRRLVDGFANGTVSCRKLVMVWAVQSAEHLEWVRPWMTSILGMEGRRDLLRIMIFVTRPDPNNPQALDVQSPSASVKMFPGRRPDVASIIDAEAADQIGTMAVSVCGSGPFSDSVRAEARKRTKLSNVDFLDESFSW